MKIQAKNKGNSYDVEFKKIQGEERIICPSCTSERKPSNQRKKDLAWSHDSKTGFCHNCQDTFFEYKEFEFKRKEYALPIWQNNTYLNDEIVKYFEKRGISQLTLKSVKISSQIEWMPQHEGKVQAVCFNYFRDGKLINVKYRAAKKAF